ncbi:hypothetical protein CLG96_04185 [Sphingomonas oleivorans]|uniref:Uncharacterized protein n=1 Tax=Sphingomonas oleivorans TaxID=1735121 RepID=A0A2T5G2D2_9SPHN|nr:hypothetical protein [Sphingomonas oleivorans]PTQ13312.1 hypothetical protein CLG96_04185 [Sphingomonas oleivorans]
MIIFGAGKRLQALRSLDLLDTAPSQAFDCLAEHAWDLFNASIAMVRLVDEARLWFKSSCGLAARKPARDRSFGDYAIKDDEPVMVAEDAATAFLSRWSATKAATLTSSRCPVQDEVCWLEHKQAV